MNCRKCGAEIVEGNTVCVQCGEAIPLDFFSETEQVQPIVFHDSELLEKKVNGTKYSYSKILGFLCAVFLIVGIVFFVEGFVVKNNCYQIDNSLGENVSVYVSDTYQNTINSMLFMGYVITGSILVLCSIICLGTSFIISSKEE